MAVKGLSYWELNVRVLGEMLRPDSRKVGPIFQLMFSKYILISKSVK